MAEVPWLGLRPFASTSRSATSPGAKPTARPFRLFQNHRGISQGRLTSSVPHNVEYTFLSRPASYSSLLAQAQSPWISTLRWTMSPSTRRRSERSSQQILLLEKNRLAGLPCAPPRTTPTNTSGLYQEPGEIDEDEVPANTDHD